MDRKQILLMNDLQTVDLLIGPVQSAHPLNLVQVCEYILHDLTDLITIKHQCLFCILNLLKNVREGSGRHQDMGAIRYAVSSSIGIHHTV